MKIALLLTLFVLVSTPLHAQTLCSTAKIIMSGLFKAYGEEIIFIGTSTNRKGQVVLMAGPTGTYSMLAVASDGSACLIETGRGAESFGHYVKGQKT